MLTSLMGLTRGSSFATCENPFALFRSVDFIRIYVSFNLTTSERIRKLNAGNRIIIRAGIQFDICVDICWGDETSDGSRTMFFSLMLFQRRRLLYDVQVRALGRRVVE